MDPEFWHQRWQNRYIGFHEGRPNKQLTAFFSRLEKEPGSHLFLPLCGKSLDIHWLLNKGYRVTGAELSTIAVRELFDELDATPEITDAGTFKVFRHENLTVFNGNIFDLTADNLGHVDAVYDRAALVALPADMRLKYTAHLNRITHNATQLLLCFDYDQSAIDGPPFSVPEEEVQRHYSQTHRITLLESKDLSGGLKGSVPASENVWLLEPRT